MSNQSNSRSSKFFLSSVFVFLFSFLALIAFGSNTITHQGTAMTYNDNIIANGDYVMRFSLWNIEVGGTEAENLKWSEVHTGDNLVKVIKGKFGVELGKITSFSEDLFRDNEKLWLQVEIDIDGSGFNVIGDREPLTASPYAFMSDEAYRADYATKASFADEAKTLNGLSAEDILASKEADLYWNLTGNAGTTPGTNFLGTTDDKALEIKVNNQRAMRIIPNVTSPSIIGGYSGNLAVSSTIGGTVGGGGASGVVNKVTDNYGTVAGGVNNCAGDYSGTTSDKQYATVGGGYGNKAGGPASTVPGGYKNYAKGSYSFASGRRATANHNGAFVWGDSQDADFTSTANNQFLIRSSGGVGINTNNPGSYKLRVTGSVGFDSALNMGAGGTPSKITNLATPTSSNDATNKQYVDNKVSTSLSALDKLIHNFVVATGESVTAGDVVVFINEKVRKGSKEEFGSKYVFNSGTSYNISSAILSSDKFVVAYRDNSNANDGTAVIGTVSGNTITFGSEYVFTEGFPTYMTISVLSSDKFVVAYCDVDNSSSGTAVVGDVSGTVITFGSEYIFNGGTTSVSASAISSDKFVVAFMDDNTTSQGRAKVGTVSGNVIAYGSEYTFNSAPVSNISATTLSSDKFIVAYWDYLGSGYGEAVVGYVSVTVITFGSEYVFNSATTNNTSVSALSSATFVVTYKDNGNSYYGTARIGTVYETVIAFSPEYVFNSASTSNISSSALSSDKFIVTYQDVGNSDYGTAIVGEVSGNTILFNGEKVFNSAASGFTYVSTFSSDKFVVSYTDGGNSNYGTGIIGRVGVPVGIANASASSGASVPVVIHGVSSNHVGLIPGRFYYHQTDGSLTTDWTNTRIGVAISSTELLLDIEH